jgi:hypothetical protein
MWLIEDDELAHSEQSNVILMVAQTVCNRWFNLSDEMARLHWGGSLSLMRWWSSGSSEREIMWLTEDDALARSER